MLEPGDTTHAHRHRAFTRPDPIGITAVRTDTPAGSRPRRRTCRGRDAGLAGDRGSSAVELVLLTPVLIALIFASIQGALLWHAKHLAVAAAQQGARLARADTTGTTGTTGTVGSTPAAEPSGTATDQQVQEATVAYLRQLGGRLLSNATVTVQHNPGWVTVTVTGRALGLLPGSTLLVHASSRTPTEAFR